MSPLIVGFAVPLLCGVPDSADRMRPVISLDGEWNLTVPGKPNVYKLAVPGSWQSQVEELRSYVGRATYSREILVPDSWQSKRVFIRFGAVDYFAEVFVNSNKVGEHEGGYTPFEFEIQEQIRFGDTNQIVVNVIDVGPGSSIGGFRFEEIPHGKQSWYGNASGLWQSVCLEARSKSYVERVVIDPDIDTSTACFRIELVDTRAGSLRVCIRAPEGASPVPDTTIGVHDGQQAVDCEIAIPDAALWSPESPALYQAEVGLVIGGEVVDTLSSTFGMRKIEARDGRILLNNKPIFLSGALDQDFYPATDYTPPSDEFLEDQFLKAKHLGLNLLRCHIKVPDPRYLQWADRLGLLVWYEIPNWITLSDDSKRRARQTLDEMLRRDHNHASLVIVSIVNEAWGVDVDDADHRKWLAEMYDYARGLEPGRLIVDNSACGRNFHVKTDIDDFHAYFSIPDQADECGRWIGEFAGRPGWSFTKDAENARRGWEPLVLSEFGNWGLPRISSLGEQDPWWFDTARSGAGTSTHPAGVRERFEQQRLGGVFGSLDGLADAFQDQEWLALKFQIEQVRKYASIAGYVITEFTDVHWESNGLLDWRRNPKTFHDRMRAVQAPDIVFAELSRHNYVSGEQVQAQVYVSHFSSAKLDSSTILWGLEGTSPQGGIDVGPLAPGEVKQVGTVQFHVPPMESSRKMRLSLTLADPDGAAVAESYQDVTVFPKKPPQGAKDVLVVDELDADTARRISDGANAVICIESCDRLRLPGDALEAVDRSKDGRWGAWCSSLIWFKDSPAFDGACVPRTMDFSFENIIPKCVIEGIGLDCWEKDVLSGMFVGWLHSPAAVVAQFRIGKGKAVITTLALISGADRDPMARFLLASLARYVDSPHCDPDLRTDTK